MIEWICDSCGERLEHEDPNPPPGWATVKAVVAWRDNDDDGSSEYESAQIVLCNKSCRTGSGAALEARSVKILRNGFDSKSRAANK